MRHVCEFIRKVENSLKLINECVCDLMRLQLLLLFDIRFSLMQLMCEGFNGSEMVSQNVLRQIL